MLLESARPRLGSATSYLFQNPHRTLSATNADELETLFVAIEKALAEGLYLAGYFAYEAGFAFEPVLQKLLPTGKTLAWFGVYDAPEVFSPHAPDATSKELPDDVRVPEIALSLAPAEYCEQVDSIRRLIESGDTYQANLTTEARWSTEDSALRLYNWMVREQPVEFAALLNLGDLGHILSVSPELFFERTGDRITTRPMKGTAPRGMDAEEDTAQAAWLAADEKNRSENLMIVDLLRNDLNRICTAGSVTAEKLFEIERFPTLFQMTSTVSGTLQPGIDYRKILHGLFPSGSIVGAPKIRTMQILHDLEQRQRGIYTGAIGFFAPGQRAVFSVAIRTLTLRNHEARIGVGSGIVYDSKATSEYQECLTKIAFLTRKTPQFDLLETLLWQDGRFEQIAEHLTRMATSAEYFNFTVDAAQIEGALHQASRAFDCSARLRVRLTVTRNGVATVTSQPISAPSVEAVNLLLHPQRTNAADVFLRHKTTYRPLYEAALPLAQSLHCADALFLNTVGEITEGAIHSIFVLRDGVWSTPPLSSGVLPGIARARLLARPYVVATSLTFDDALIVDAITICNSVRGSRSVSHILQQTGAGLQTIWTAREPHVIL